MNFILDDTKSIKEQISEVAQWLSTLSETERVLASRKIKSVVQREAEDAFIRLGSWGCIYAATGVGKSKIPIDILHDYYDQTHKVLLVVPTEKLRDEGWRDEFKKWECDMIYNNIVESTCYASLANIIGEEYDLVILDEIHNVTDNNSEFFKNNVVKACIGLTATRPKDPTKKAILKQLELDPVYELGLDEAVKLGITAPYDITIVTMTLDGDKKYLKAGNAAKGTSFLQTEKEKYAFLTRVCFAAPSKFSFINRMQFIYNLESKKEVAKLILKNVIPEDLKTLIFCGSVDQAIDVCAYRYYSKPTAPKEENKKTGKKTKDYERKLAKYSKAIENYPKDTDYNLFKNNLINRMSCCEALNEGENIPDIDVEFIIQLNANDKDLLQRMGRSLRVRQGHRGNIIVLCVEGTVDEDWVKKATIGLDKANIKKVELGRLRVGLDKIDF